jgi:predicted metalloprotease with PDZ domain
MKPQHAPVHYEIACADVHAHLFRITLTVAEPAALQVLQLPVWIPGSYLVRELAKHLQHLRCTQSDKPVPTEQTDKSHWQVHCDPSQPLQAQYEVYARDASVRAAWLDAQRGFFNGTSLCLRVLGQEAQPHTLTLAASNAPNGWSLATGLPPLRVDKMGFGTYRAQNYDALVDCPVEMGRFWSGSFQVHGIPHRFVVAGAADSFDGERLLADAQAICHTQIAFWHGKATHDVPFKTYLFLLNAVDDGYGGLEHRNSTALICQRKDLPRRSPDKQPEGYTTLLGLISHEYFHTWNVKRLRPTEFAHYDYTQENYTELLWFFEGFTSYYDDLLLRRAGRIDNTIYLKLLSKTINQVQQTPGRRVQTVAQASRDAWIKYYRQDENTANATVSYYTKGALVALCLDLHLRAAGHTDLDAVMRGLWQRCAGGPMAESDLAAVLLSLGGRSYARELARWVHSTAELPWAELLEQHGIQVNREPDALAQQLGLRLKESGALTVTQVLRGGAAEQAGFAAGDEWLAVQPGGAAAKATAPWRVHTQDDLTLYCGAAKQWVATVARDKRLLQLTLKRPKTSFAARLSVRDTAAANRWLGPQHDAKTPNPPRGAL